MADLPRMHALGSDVRERDAQQQRDVALGRIGAATGRDDRASARDRAAAARDRAADERDRDLVARDRAWRDADGATTGAQVLLRAAEARRRAQADRSAAAQARAESAADRESAAADREEAARDRDAARADREVLLHNLAIAETDALTGARTRGAGLADLEHEIDRARRTSISLVVAYVDVVGLKAVNDSRGHAAGDALLQRAVRGLQAHLRSYDTVVRVGGDEFVCVMSGATLAGAEERFRCVRGALAAAPEPSEIRVGLAMLRPEETAAELVARADAALPAMHGRSASRRLAG